MPVSGFMCEYTKITYMAGKPAHLPEMVANRPRRTDGGKEPLYDEEMTITLSGNSLVVGVTSVAVDIQGLQKGEKAHVYVYDDGVWVQTGGESDDFDSGSDEELFSSEIADADEVLGEFVGDGGNDGQ